MGWLLIVMVLPVGAERTTFVPAGSVWTYLDDGSDQGMAWYGAGFDDSGWASGSAELGYGDGDEATVVSFGPDDQNKYTTTYFRHTFNVSDASGYNSMRLEVLRDDGAVVYLNGTEIFRTNMPETSNYLTFASSVLFGGDEDAFYGKSLDASGLVDGDNVLAVEVHQSTLTSSDMSFDLFLMASDRSSTFTLLAASVKDFSGAQGLNNWHYGYYDGDSSVPFTPDDFEEFTYYDTNSTAWKIDPSEQNTRGFYTAVWNTGGHPNDWVEIRVVRRWISDTSGSITIAGNLAKIDARCGDGVSGHIFLDGNEIWSSPITWNDSVGVFYELPLDVVEGSILDFAIAPNGSDACDGSRFTTFIYKGGPLSDTPALVARYPFDQDTRDTSGNGFHGAVNGVATLVQDPERGGVLSLDGDGGHILVMGIGHVLDGCTDITVACWIKSNEISSNRGFVIFEDPRNANRGIRYDSSGSVNGGQNIIKCGIDSVFGHQAYESSSDVQTTDWQHVAITWSSGDQVRLYIDGVEDTSGPVHVNRDGFLIGYSNLIIGKGSKDQGWNGLIDDVRIYNRALSETEISTLYNASEPPVADANGPYTLYAGDTLTLDASGSTDDENDITSYVWDLDDDGVFETDAGTQAVFDVSYAYLESLGLGIGVDYNIHLKVTDGDEQADTDTTTLTIEPALVIAVDIKPTSCPNPLNVKSKGVLPVAILGSDSFDVATIVISSLRLAGVAPLRDSYEDVATPVGDVADCNCVEDGPDGFVDLTLKFKTQQIVEALGEVEKDDVITLELTGVLFDETPIEGADCILIRGRHKPIDPADINKDGVVNAADFAIFTQNWLQSSIVDD